MNKEEILKNAKKHCFFIGLNDSGAELCKANAVYGIAGIHCVQSQLGMSPNATFISTPDMTITRNTSRWKSGFGYGGKISWGEGNDDLLILNVKPNACGMLVGGLEQLPDIESLINKLHKLEMDTIKIDGVKVVWDFYKSNHFIDVFEVKPLPRLILTYRDMLLPYMDLPMSSVGIMNQDSACITIRVNNCVRWQNAFKHRLESFTFLPAKRLKSILRSISV